MDYIHDVRHDKWLDKERQETSIMNLNSWRAYNAWKREYYMKEGSVWHYIRQRLIARKIKGKK